MRVRLTGIALGLILTLVTFQNCGGSGSDAVDEMADQNIIDGSNDETPSPPVDPNIINGGQSHVTVHFNGGPVDPNEIQRVEIVITGTNHAPIMLTWTSGPPLPSAFDLVVPKGNGQHINVEVETANAAYEGSATVDIATGNVIVTITLNQVSI